MKIFNFFFSFLFFIFCSVVLDRPSSQMSFLDQFLKESPFRTHSNSGSEDGADEADIEDNPSLASSKSNTSNHSLVSYRIYPTDIFTNKIYTHTIPIS